MNGAAMRTDIARAIVVRWGNERNRVGAFGAKFHKERIVAVDQIASITNEARIPAVTKGI